MSMLDFVPVHAVEYVTRLLVDEMENQGPQTWLSIIHNKSLIIFAIIC